MPRIFISHSHSDEDIADLLFEFLNYALQFTLGDILCTSDPSSGLKLNSTSISDQLKANLKQAEVLVALITQDSLRSPWISFEIGSFWPTEKPIVLILGPGLSPERLPGPLKGWLSIRIEDEQVMDHLNSAVNQLVIALSAQPIYDRRREKKVNAFISKFRAWQSRYPEPDQSLQDQVKALQGELKQVQGQQRELEREKQELVQQLEAEKLQVQQAEEQIKALIQKREELEHLRGLESTNIRAEKQQLEQQLETYAKQVSQQREKLQSAQQELVRQDSGIAELERPSSVKLVPSQEKQGQQKPPLLIYDPEIAMVWGQNPQNIWIYGEKTLAFLKPEELASYKERWGRDVVLMTTNELFLPELYFIDSEEALPGGLLPQKGEPLIFNGNCITPLIPINPILLDYLTPEDLVDKVKFQPLKSIEGVQVQLVIDLPLSGVNQNQENYRLNKVYAIKEENSLGDQLPLVQVWPNFQAEGWQEYYSFYYDTELGDATFQTQFPNVDCSYPFDENFGKFKIERLTRFPEYIACLNNEQQMIGLILLQSAETIQLRNNWTVGVDFGTSFTNVYVKAKDIPKPLQFENLQLQVTDVPLAIRYQVLFEYFIPENFIPREKSLPLSSLLTTRPNTLDRSDLLNNRENLSVIKARIYVPDNEWFDPQKDWINTNLKWSSKEDLALNKLFLRHLALHIAAMAAQANVKRIQWCFSYPSAFSMKDQNFYAQVWQDLLNGLQDTTGIEHHCPEMNSEYFRPESLAMAQYCADFEGHDFVYSTCIDLGGGTSDISIWERNQLVHQCSVQLAGQDIFSQFLKMYPGFMEKYFDENVQQWQMLRAGHFNAKLDVWLRLKSEKWLHNERALLQNKSDLQGLIRLTAIGIAGLYYYTGILLKVLHNEGNYSREEITPVFMGGNGSRFLNWLDVRGNFDHHSEFNWLLSRMLSVASGFEDSEQLTRLSKSPKDEAACGLLLGETRLKGLKKNAEDPLIAGEACQIKIVDHEDEEEKTLEIGAYGRLEMENSDFDLVGFKVPELNELPKFLYQFHLAMKDWNIEEITPLPDYRHSPDKESNQALWKDVERELENLLLQFKGDAYEIRFEPPFILGLKALLRVLGKEWASNHSNQ